MRMYARHALVVVVAAVATCGGAEVRAVLVVAVATYVHGCSRHACCRRCCRNSMCMCLYVLHTQVIVAVTAVTCVYTGRCLARECCRRLRDGHGTRGVRRTFVVVATAIRDCCYSCSCVSFLCFYCSWGCCRCGNFDCCAATVAAESRCCGCRRGCMLLCCSCCNYGCSRGCGGRRHTALLLL